MVSDDPPESHRRRRSGHHRHGTAWSRILTGSPVGRRLAALGTIGAIVLAAIVTTIVLSGGFGGASNLGGGAGGPSLGLSTGAGASVAVATDTLPPVPTVASTSGPSDKPAGIIATRIVIARLGINLRIVAGDGIDAPLGKAAHYPGTAWPGGGSNIYIYAHAQTGMFLSLWQAKVGDQVVLTLADGTTRTYVVSQVLPKVPWDDLALLDPTPTEQLTLQTCTSYFATSPRFVVIALPQS